MITTQQDNTRLRWKNLPSLIQGSLIGVLAVTTFFLSGLALLIVIATIILLTISAIYSYYEARNEQQRQMKMDEKLQNFTKKNSKLTSYNNTLKIEDQILKGKVQNMQASNANIRKQLDNLNNETTKLKETLKKSETINIQAGDNAHASTHEFILEKNQFQEQVVGLTSKINMLESELNEERSAKQKLFQQLSKYKSTASLKKQKTKAAKTGYICIVEDEKTPPKIKATHTTKKQTAISSLLRKHQNISLLYQRRFYCLDKENRDLANRNNKLENKNTKLKAKNSDLCKLLKNNGEIKRNDRMINNREQVTRPTKLLSSNTFKSFKVVASSVIKKVGSTTDNKKYRKHIKKYKNTKTPFFNGRDISHQNVKSILKLQNTILNEQNDILKKSDPIASETKTKSSSTFNSGKNIHPPTKPLSNNKKTNDDSTPKP